VRALAENLTSPTDVKTPRASVARLEQVFEVKVREKRNTCREPALFEKGEGFDLPVTGQFCLALSCGRRSRLRPSEFGLRRAKSSSSKSCGSDSKKGLGDLQETRTQNR